MEITMEVIERVERALGFTLYENQVNYLLDVGELGDEPESGRTTAYCISLLLTDGEPLDLAHPEMFSDRINGERHIHYARRVFIKEFLDIRAKLADAAIKVRDVKNFDPKHHMGGYVF